MTLRADDKQTRLSRRPSKLSARYLDVLLSVKTDSTLLRLVKSKETVGNSWTVLKSYLGSQISSQSLNEIHICRLQPKSATKDEFFSSYFVFDCQFESAHVAL